MSNRPMVGLPQVLVAGIGATAAVVGSFFAAQATVDMRVAALDAKVQVVTEREDNHFVEVQSSLKRIEDKVDRVNKNNP